MVVVKLSNFGCDMFMVFVKDMYLCYCLYLLLYIHWFMCFLASVIDFSTFIRVGFNAMRIRAIV